MLSAKSQGWPERKMDSAAAFTRSRKRGNPGADDAETRFKCFWQCCPIVPQVIGFRFGGKYFTGVISAPLFRIPRLTPSARLGICPRVPEPRCGKDCRNRPPVAEPDSGTV